MKDKVMPMTEYRNTDYANLELPEELLISLAKALAPEIRKFYDSDEGKAYFKKWMNSHSESAHSSESIW